MPLGGSSFNDNVSTYNADCLKGRLIEKTMFFFTTMKIVWKRNKKRRDNTSTMYFTFLVITFFCNLTILNIIWAMWIRRVVSFLDYDMVLQILLGLLHIKALVESQYHKGWVFL